ncbi:MAG: SCP2 sterol-binding domain-containing protein [Chloroflexota bacterium]|nr:SCP2 sterol-binding domain-containing protein [Chloroflexota bacterium]
MTQQLPSSLKEAFTNMPSAFKAERAAGVSTVIQFKVTGAEAGNWILEVKEGKCTVTEGEAPSPNVTINTPSEIWLKILRRELDGATAFMSGQFTFTGDMGILMQMGSWFEQ